MAQSQLRSRPRFHHGCHFEIQQKTPCPGVGRDRECCNQRSCLPCSIKVVMRSCKLFTFQIGDVLGSNVHLIEFELELVCVFSKDCPTGIQNFDKKYTGKFTSLALSVILRKSLSVFTLFSPIHRRITKGCYWFPTKLLGHHMILLGNLMTWTVAASTERHLVPANVLLHSLKTSIIYIAFLYKIGLQLEDLEAVYTVK